MEKVRIDKNGILWLNRAGKMKKQFCKFSANSVSVFSCGDDCPLFRVHETPEYADGKEYLINLGCGGHNYYIVAKENEFVDERVNGDDK